MDERQNILDQVEKALDIKLYDWQRTYILGREWQVPKSERHTGRTLAYTIKLLAFHDKPIRKKVLHNYADTPGRGMRYCQWYRRYALEINEKLTAAGIKTCIVD